MSLLYISVPKTTEKDLYLIKCLNEETINYNYQEYNGLLEKEATRRGYIYSHK